jgi:hypothetical protein
LSWAEYLQTDDRTFGALFLRKLEESSGIQYQRALLEIVEELSRFLEKLSSALSGYITGYVGNHQKNRRRGADDSDFAGVR